MDDLISRQAAIEELRKMAIALYGYDVTSVISCAIYKLQNLSSAEPKTCAYWDRESNICALHRPSAQPEQIVRDIATIIENEKDMRVILKNTEPEQRWIPVTERMPEEKDAGILTKLGTSKRSEYVLATVEVKGERMTVTACTYDGVWNWDKKFAFTDYKVVAWMPLPEPYRKGEENE